MPLVVTIGLGGNALGKLDICRHDGLEHGKDLYRYSASFSAPDWNEGNPVTTKVFRHRYSHGCLSLVHKAIEQITEEHPELVAARFGVPRNRAKCRRCGDVIWSMYRHDFTRCSCGAIAVDGGYDYVRRIGSPRNMINVLEPWQQLKSKPKKEKDDPPRAAK